MQKLATTFYWLVGVIFPVLIGLLHTWVHFTDLTTPAVETALQVPISLIGEQQAAWKTWGIVSFMIRTSFVFIGLLNIILLRQRPAGAPPPLAGWLVMLLYLTCVVYVGVTFAAPPQLYGGIFGLVLGVIGLGLSLRGQKQ